MKKYGLRQEAHQRGYRVTRCYDNVRSLPVQNQSSALQQEKQCHRKEAKEELEGFGLTDVNHLFFKKYFFGICFPSYIYNGSFIPFCDTVFRGSKCLRKWEKEKKWRELAGMLWSGLLGWSPIMIMGRCICPIDTDHWASQSLTSVLQMCKTAEKHMNYY